jgi:predicted metal-binding protein
MNDVAQNLHDTIMRVGYDFIGSFNVRDLNPRQDVRDMCAADKCNAYDKSWACPPACGSLEQFASQFEQYTDGFLFQTVAQMADPLDWDGIEAAMKLHSSRSQVMLKEIDKLLDTGVKVMFMGAGTGCERCAECTYPDTPCRFPESLNPSMEAGGLLVSEVCELADVPYYHGQNTVAFCSCLLY